jgi:hypothetical protein
MGLWLSAVANGCIGCAWVVLAVQRYKMMKREQNESIIEEVLAQIDEEVEVALGIDDEETPVVTQPAKDVQPV